MNVWDMRTHKEKGNYAIGFDFGTSRSLMAIKAPGEKAVCVVPDAQVYRKGIPSLFYHPKEESGLPDEVTCGDVLLFNAPYTDPLGVVQSIKMLLHQDEIVLHNRKYAPTDICKKVMESILQISKNAVATMDYEDVDLTTNVVMGAPVRFGEAQRMELLNAAHKAGFQKITLLPEPMAAALYYQNTVGEPTDMCLVFDQGAGSFDTVILDKNHNITSENPYPYTARFPEGSLIGGDRFDEAMVELIIKKLELGNPSMDLSSLKDVKSWDYRQLLERAREAKENLSEVESTTVMITGDFGYGIAQVTREEFEQAIEPYVRQNVDIAENILNKANAIGNRELTVIMVGGGSLMPLVKRMLQERFPWIPKDKFLIKAPDQAIALGCAIYAETASFQRRLVYGYGMKVIVEGKYCLQHIIPSNVALPYFLRQEYWTTTEHNIVSFKLFEIPNAVEGEYTELDEMAYSNIRLDHDFGRIVPKGTEVLLTIKISEDGVLAMTCNDGGLSDNSVSTVKRSISCKTM